MRPFLSFIVARRQAIRYRFASRIAASPEKVFAYLSDLTRHPEWGRESGGGQSLVEVRAVDDSPLGKGKRYRSSAKWFDDPVVADLTIAEFLPTSSFAFDVHERRGDLVRSFTIRFALKPGRGGTRVRQDVIRHLSGSEGLGFLRQVPDYYRKVVQPAVTGGLASLKAKLEGTPEAPAS